MHTALEILDLVIDMAWKKRALAVTPRAEQDVTIELLGRADEPVTVKVRQGESKIWFPRERSRDGSSARDFDRDRVYILTERDRVQVELHLQRTGGVLRGAQVKRVRTLGAEPTHHRPSRNTRATLIA